MREVRPSDQFERSWPLLRRAGLVDPDDLQTVFYLLQKDEPLPTEYNDHALRGKYEGYREFHLSGDIIVIYRATRDRVVMLNVGTHAGMFGGRKHKRKGVEHPSKSFGEAIDEALADAARKLKKWWRRGSRD